MPVLVDEDLRFEDEHGVLATVNANQWLRELPSSGAPSPNTGEAYARALRAWLEFLAERGVPGCWSGSGMRMVLLGGLRVLAAFVDDVTGQGVRVEA
jgi:hypothetical protein